ncbi:MAG TPA: hypothetical protein VN018_07650 [Brevundimonas sp.]|nr:hypothetical protein [Brevundimonas sp.]
MDRVADNERLQTRVAREEATIQGALLDRHRQIEALVGRPVPRSLMTTGQDSRDGAGALTDEQYEARLDALRAEHPDQLAGIETREEMIARLSGRPIVTRYDTAEGPAWVSSTGTGGLWLSTQSGRTGPLSSFPGARPVRADPDRPRFQGDGSSVSAGERSLGERWSSTADDFVGTSQFQAAGRFLISRGPQFDEFEDPDNPGQTIRYASFGQMVIDHEEERRDSYRLLSQNDAWNAGDASFLHKLARGVVTLGGALGGSATDPTNLIAPGRTALARIGGAVVVNAGTDVLAQGADIATGIEDRYRPEQTAAAAALGGVIQGGGEAAGALSRLVNRNPVPDFDGAAMDAVPTVAPRPTAPPSVPALRAALSRIDRERTDAARIGPADGPQYETAKDALESFRMPERPDVERELEALFDNSDIARPAPQAAPVDVPRAVDPDRPPQEPPTPASQPTPGPIAPAGLMRAEHMGRPVQLGSFDPRGIGADPASFQFRPSGDEGLTGALDGVTAWDPARAGRAILFERRDGTVLAADGHQRRGLARRLIESGEDPTVRMDGYLMREAEGWTVQDVRTVAALRNMREGAGTVLDAAKLFRDARDLINDRTLPITGDFAELSRALARLQEDAFAAVEAGDISVRAGSAIGELASDRPDLQLSMVKLIQEGDPRSLGEIYSLIHERRLAEDAVDADLAGPLFGNDTSNESLIARARLRAAVLQGVHRSDPMFDALTRHADVIEADGMALARTDAEARVARDMVAMSAVDKLALISDEGADPFGLAVAAVRSGEMTQAEAVKGVLNALRTAADAINQADAERAAAFDPRPPSEEASVALAAFADPDGPGQRGQVTPKPEDAEAEASASKRWDDLPEVEDEERALNVLRVCAPGVK